jgi:hypothetical protein
MAKGKSAVALFEVIHKDKRFDRKTPEAAQKPPVEGSPVEASPVLAAQAVDLWRKRNSDPETWTNSPVKIRQPLSVRISGQIAAFKAGYQSGISRSAKTAEAARAWIVRQNSVAFGAAAAIVVIGTLALARHWHNPAGQAIPIEQVLRDGPAHPTVLAVTATNAPASQNLDSLSPEMQADVQQADDKTAPSPTTANLAQPGARIVNMHYVLMQSYFEEKTADEARDYLIKNGIACTIERGVKGWRADFYQVIGLQGFARPSGAEYVAYRDHIVDLGKTFSKSKYKRFQPEAIKW